MSAQSQLQAYALWLRDRGLAYPVRRSVPVPVPVKVPVQEQPALAPLAALASAAAACTACELSSQRIDGRSAFGYGSERARVVFLGDGAFDEAAQTGVALAGEERALLDRMIAAMNLTPDDVYITNALLCPPRADRVPDAAVFASCRRHLSALLSHIEPRLVVALGQVAARAALGRNASFHAVRGRIVAAPELGGRQLLATFHPRDLLRHPANKRLAWSDLQIVMEHLR